jgi:signal peptidase II
VKRADWTILWPWNVLVLAGVAGLDQWTKWLVQSRLALHDSIAVIPGFFDLVLVRNRGAAWGILANHTWLLTAISLAVLLFVCGRFRYLAEGWPERGVAIALLAGGIVGNLIDRIWLRAVTDFLRFYYRDFEWPSFNVADSAICIGIFLYIMSSALRPETASEPGPDRPPDAVDD